jgi:IPT/TIG domain-containing protein
MPRSIYVSATQLTASINAADIATTGNVTVAVATPMPGGGISSDLGVVLNNPSPTVKSLSQSSAAAGGAGFTLTVSGTNFTPGSVVQWNGTNQITTYVSPTQLTVQITTSDIAAAGSATVTVLNAAPQL